MRLNISIPTYLITYINTYRSSKCTAWYVLKCIKYCNDNNIDLHEYYAGIDNDRVESIRKEGEG